MNLDEVPNDSFNRAFQSGLPIWTVIGIAKDDMDDILEVAAYLLYRYDDMFFRTIGTRKDYLARAALLRHHFAESERDNS